MCTLILPGAGTLAIAQSELPPPAPQVQQGPPPQEISPQENIPLLSPDQLNNLVAPVALYPDPLLAQVLAAATYPLEIVEAQQWLQQNSGLRGQQLIDAARQQNWDPSVQALVAFPDAMALLSRDVQWTTDLGNAFLAQQADVMGAVQRMRARAQQSGRLQSTPQQVVTSQYDNGQSAIQIQPADPQVIYVPQYNPVYVWGPPVWGGYPPLWYPPVSYGCGFGAGVFLGGLFAGFLGFGGWGWGLSWLSHGLFLNGLFFNHFGFGGYHGGFGGFGGGRTWWAHDPVHRMGVAYPNHALASRFGSASGRFNGFAANRSYSGAGRSYAGGAGRSYAGGAGRSYAGGAGHSYSGGAGQSSAGGWRSFNGGGQSQRSYSAPRGNFGSNSFQGSNRAPTQSTRSYSGSGMNRYSSPGGNPGAANRYSSPGGNFGATNRYSAPRENFGGNSFRAPAQSSRSFSSPSQHFSAPRSSGGGHFSAPKSSGSSHSSGGHSSGGHSSGGHGGGSHRR